MIKGCLEKEKLEEAGDKDITGLRGDTTSSRQEELERQIGGVKAYRCAYEK